MKPHPAMDVNLWSTMLASDQHPHSLTDQEAPTRDYREEQLTGNKATSSVVWQDGLVAIVVTNIQISPRTWVLLPLGAKSHQFTQL